MLSNSDVFLLPSVTASNGDMEGIPVALMEAMATGLPVISSYHSGILSLYKMIILVGCAKKVILKKLLTA